ncbi:MAG: hypothetical protein PHV37_04285 [Candidatus Gastranaerophilales bacterium]|nr:hypothetical protein [Candidatus Gastranaerophilales bacterium]
MAKNQLPEGVGKKIVEALKRQSEIEINPIEEEIVEPPVIKEQTATAVQEIEEPVNDNLEIFEDVISNEVTNNIAASNIDSQENFIIEDNEPVVIPNNDSSHFNFNVQPVPQIQEEPVESPISYQAPKEVNMNNAEKTTQVDVPANVAVLKRLISQLPAGVTKQTGAQIIRQTIEALGISMNQVLQEAQQVQDNLNGSIKDCMTKVQEYKTNIMYLERHAQDYQRQVTQINDLISLFVLTDKVK